MNPLKEYKVSKAAEVIHRRNGAANPRLPEKLPERLPEKLPERLPEKLPEKLGERRRVIIDRIRVTPRATISELMAELGISHTAVKNNIAWLKEHGYIRRIGPDKGGHWEVIGGE